MTPTVSIHANGEDLATQTLRAVRECLPDAHIVVFDTSGSMEARERVMLACAEIDADFTAMTSPA